MWVFCDECGSMLRRTQRRCPVCRQHPGQFADTSGERSAARWLSIFFAAATTVSTLCTALIVNPALVDAVLAAATR